MQNSKESREENFLTRYNVPCKERRRMKEQILAVQRIHQCLPEQWLNPCGTLQFVPGMSTGCSTIFVQKMNCVQSMQRRADYVLKVRCLYHSTMIADELLRWHSADKLCCRLIKVAGCSTAPGNNFLLIFCSGYWHSLAGLQILRFGSPRWKSVISLRFCGFHRRQFYAETAIPFQRM